MQWPRVTYAEAAVAQRDLGEHETKTIAHSKSAILPSSLEDDALLGVPTNGDRSNRPVATVAEAVQ